jgi:tRNA modification GTPase
MNKQKPSPEGFFITHYATVQQELDNFAKILAVNTIPNTETICALSTPPGVSAIAVVRICGNDALEICKKVFFPAKEGLAPNRAVFGTIKDGDSILDEVVATYFKAPHSYNGEDIVEISCHGSVYVQQRLLQLLIENGASTAKPGEFTMRAFLNGKMDLSRAEAVADLISSASSASHKVAMQQMRGGFSDELKALRDKFIEFAALIELELDFSEEDVEFADRTQLEKLLKEITIAIESLAGSFAVGNAIKHGVPVVIAGAPNVGKSTLLNALLKEERAIVSDIPGTTRDFIEDTIDLNGVLFRFIDTAGIRKSSDKIEAIGIEKTFEKIGRAAVVLCLFDGKDSTVESVEKTLAALPHSEGNELLENGVIPVINKVDLDDTEAIKERFQSLENAVFISAKEKLGLKELTDQLSGLVSLDADSNAVVVSNSRHYEALTKALEAVNGVSNGLVQGISGDLLAIDIRRALHHLGEITGEITNDELLGNIFSRFCIGK